MTSLPFTLLLWPAPNGGNRILTPGLSSGIRHVGPTEMTVPVTLNGVSLRGITRPWRPVTVSTTGSISAVT